MGILCLAKHLKAKKTNVHNILIETLCIIKKQSIEMHVVEFVFFLNKQCFLGFRCKATCGGRRVSGGF